MKSGFHSAQELPRTADCDRARATTPSQHQSGRRAGKLHFPAKQPPSNSAQAPTTASSTSSTASSLSSITFTRMGSALACPTRHCSCAMNTQATPLLILPAQTHRCHASCLEVPSRKLFGLRSHMKQQGTKQPIMVHTQHGSMAHIHDFQFTCPASPYHMQDLPDWLRRQPAETSRN